MPNPKPKPKAPPVPVPKPDAVEGQHIFPEDELHALAVQWKDLNGKAAHNQAMQVLELVVERSTPMFERLAQHEKFHHTVDLQILVSAAQEKVVKWLLRWQPKKGRLFSWFSKCAKHAFLSELVKVNQYRRRYHSTSDSLEQFIGVEDHEVDKEDMAREVRTKLDQLTCRWGDPQEIGAVRFLIECIVDDERDKQAAIRSAAYAYGISPEMSKFFHAWALTALRAEFAEKIRMPITEQDLFILAESYGHIPGLLDFLSWDQIKQIFVRYGGMRLKIPTLSYLARLKEEHEIWREIDASDKDPDSIAEVALRHKKTPRSATEIYEEMSRTLDPRRAGEHFIFDHEHDAQPH